MSDLAALHDDLRAVARDVLAAAPSGEVGWGQLAELGWLALEVPAGLDGAGATFAEVAVVLHELGRAAAPSSYLGTVVLGVGALLAVEPGADRDELLRRVAAGQRRVAVALSPTGDGATCDPPFRLVDAGEHVELHGRAAMVVDAGEADDLLLLATDPEGHLVLVHAAASQVVTSDRPVVDATRRFADVDATGAAVGASAVWRFAGDPAVAAQGVLDRAAVAVACDSLGVAAAMLDRTVAYVTERHQFGRPVGSFQAVKHACADVQVALAVGRQLVDAAIAAVVAGDDEAGLAVARAASFASEVGVEAAGTAMQLHGGIGYSWESGIHTFLKRATLDRALCGSPADHRRRLARAIADR